MGTHVTYEADGWEAYLQEDKYETGCEVDSGFCKSGGERFTGATAAECIDACRSFCGADPSAIEVDPCGDEPGRVDMQVMETDHAYVADDGDTQLWKEGKRRLWLADYTFVVRKVTRSDPLRSEMEPSKARAAAAGPVEEI